MKKVNFFEIVFTNKYFINSIDVLNINNLKFIDYINIDLNINTSFSKINKAKLYKIKDLNIEIAIAEVRDFKIICYFKPNTFFKLSQHPRHKESLIKNYKLLDQFVVDKLKNKNEENVIYSPDYHTRALINLSDNKISLTYQKLDFMKDYLNEDINSDNFWFWEDFSGISFYDSIEKAKKEANLFLNNCDTSFNNDFNASSYNSLWKYSLSKKESWLYQMKFVTFGIICFLAFLLIFPILGLANWNVLLFFGICLLISLNLSGSVLWNNSNIIYYEVSDKGIHAVKGLLYECEYKNRKKNKIKKNIFNKNKGSIKFKLHKGLAINYNFDNITNPKEVYMIIQNNLNKNL